MRMLNVKARESLKFCGQLSNSITREPDTYIIYITRRRKYRESCTNSSFVKSLQTQCLSQNGKRQVLKSFAVCNAFRRLINNLERDAYAECPRISLKKARRLSANHVAAEDVHPAIDKWNNQIMKNNLFEI